MSRLKESVIVHSGMAVSDRQHHSHGVAMIFSERTATAWRTAGSVFDPVSRRIVRVRLKLHTGYVSLFTMYAPTNEPKNEHEAEEFISLCRKW